MNANELREVLHTHRELTLKAHRFEQARDRAVHERDSIIDEYARLQRRLFGIGFSLLAVERLMKGLPLTAADRTLILERLKQPEEA